MRLTRVFCLFAFVALSDKIAQAQDQTPVDAALRLDVINLDNFYPQPSGALTLTLDMVAQKSLGETDLRYAILKNGSNALLNDGKTSFTGVEKGGRLQNRQTIILRADAQPGDYRIEMTVIDAKTGVELFRNPSATGFIIVPAAAPLPYAATPQLSAYDMLDSLGTGVGLTYQLAPDYPNKPWDKPNRNGEQEVIAALRYLGLYHIRNEGLNDDPQENALRPPPGVNAPSDFQNFLTLRAAIPGLKLNYLIDGANPHWGDGDVIDPTPVLKKLAAMDALAAIEGPNEPNFQCVTSPRGIAYTPCGQGADYSQNIPRANEIWSDWGKALRALKQSDPAFAAVPLLPPTIGGWGPNGPDGVEINIAKAGLRDHSALYDLMAIHSYGPNGLSLGDPQGDIASGNPPNWGAYQISIPNWGRYAMPGRGVIITESGSNARKSPAPGASERAQGLALLNNFFWARYYGALRLYQYTLVDDSTDLSDEKADRWGFFRGDWSAKPAADYVHRFTQAINDPRQSDPQAIPAFTIEGLKSATWGAVMSLSKSDGSTILLCNNVLPWQDIKSGADLTPDPEVWTIAFARPVTYRTIDVVTDQTSDWRTSASIPAAIRGYPQLIHIKAAEQ